MAEIELSVLARQCLDQRVADRPTLERLTKAWEEERDNARATVHWQFMTADARIKLERLYACTKHD